jgi:hypothetical protein
MHRPDFLHFYRMRKLDLNHFIFARFPNAVPRRVRVQNPEKVSVGGGTGEWKKEHDVA